MRGLIFAALAALPLAACVAPQAPAPPPASVAAAPGPSASGLEAVMGATAQRLIAQFGTPDLDLREGPARKLQFLAPACVLDAYLYPPRSGRASRSSLMSTPASRTAARWTAPPASPRSRRERQTR